MRAGFHRGDAVSGGALPRPLVVLSDRLQEQRAVGFYGVRRATSQVNLPRDTETIYTWDKTLCVCLNMTKEMKLPT